MRGKDGVALHCDRDAEAGRVALEATLADIGHARTEERTAIEGVVYVGRAGVCLQLDLAKAAGLVVARRVARRLARPVRVFSASLVSDDPIDCALDDLTIPPEGAPKQGRWGRDLADEYDGDFAGFCDGKAYFAVSACLEDAATSVLGTELQRREVFFTPAPSLGQPRLDEIARQVRLADEAVLSVVGGRSCVRVKNAGATVTSFVTADELVVLQGALGALLSAK